MFHSFLQGNPVYKNLWVLWFLFTLSALSFLTTLHLTYIGEEAVYTITTLEMAQNHQWFVPTLYGDNYARPPLLNWLILLVAKGLGYENILLASRLVAFFSAMLISFALIGFVQKLFQNKFLSLFSALIYLSGDLLFRRGWLAYADPLFSFFVFCAIAFLWLAIDERIKNEKSVENEKNIKYQNLIETKQKRLLFFAALSVIASFLTKAISGYVFYFLTLFVFILYYKKSKPSNIRFLFKPYSLFLHFLMLIFPLIWELFFGHGMHSGGMIRELFLKWEISDFLNYLLKIFIFPLDTFLRWLPASGLILYYIIRGYYIKDYYVKDYSIKGDSIKKSRFNFFAYSKVFYQRYFKENHLKILALIILVNAIPYWLAPVSHTRYMMPLYPFIAILIAHLLCQIEKDNKYCIKIAVIALSVSLLIKYPLGLWGFSLYEKKYRGNYQAVAEAILKKCQPFPIYVDNVTSVGLSVAAHINLLNWPRGYLSKPINDWSEGFLIASSKDIPNTEISDSFLLGRYRLYLLCRGKACASEPSPGAARHPLPQAGEGNKN